MAGWVRFAIDVAAMLVALAAFIGLPSPWAWIAPLALLLAGGVLAEGAFRRLASPAEIRDDLEDRIRNPPD